MMCDDIQEAIITSPADYLLVSAVPGSGKTFVLTQRAKFLCDKGYNVLALAFNKKAAEEIRNRVSHKNLLAKTIHSFCYTSDFTLDTQTNDDDNYFRNVMPSLTHKHDFTGILENYCFNENIQLPDFDYVLIDEFQDITNLQFLALQKVLQKAKGFLVVGDFYQAIYQFNGSNTSIFKDLMDDKRFTLFSLIKNYRSSINIVKYVSSLFGVHMLPERNFLGNVLNLSQMFYSKSLVYLCRFNKTVHELRRLGMQAYTIHSVKGLEFENVFCDLPPFYSDTELLYVAMTRAKNNLVFSYHTSSLKTIHSLPELEFILAT